jgi:hypothetical protein
MKKFTVLFLIVSLCLGLSPDAAYAQSRPLPPPPPQHVIDGIISQTSGIPFEPLGIPSYVFDRLKSFRGAFKNVESMLDPSQAVTYFSTQSSLMETVIPLVNNGSTILAPDMTAPGAKSVPGKIIGVLFQPPRDVMVIVAVFKGTELKKVRFYSDSNSYYETSVYKTKFKDYDGDGRITLLDEGALIAQYHSCVTVGFDQVCWAPYDTAVVRDENGPESYMANAIANLMSTYPSVVTEFKSKHAVPDLLGHSQRIQCRTQMQSATWFYGLASCTPNVIFTSSKYYMPDQPIGVMVVLQAADIRTYDAPTGTYIGQLPPGQYFVVDATPNRQTPGEVGVLYLVNQDGVHHYLIPVMLMEGVGETGDISDKPQAAIKDGFVWGRGFGY